MTTEERVEEIILGLSWNGELVNAHEVIDAVVILVNAVIAEQQDYASARERKRYSLE